jgi:hypothetical protein
MKTLIAFTNLAHLIAASMFGALALSCGAVSIAADTSDVPQIVVTFEDPMRRHPPQVPLQDRELREPAR